MAFHAFFLVARAHLARASRHKVIVRTEFDQARVEQDLIAATLQHAAFEIVVQDHSRLAGPGLKRVNVAAQEVLRRHRRHEQLMRRKGADHRRGWSAPFVAGADYWTTYWTTTVAAPAPDCDFTVPTVTTTGWVPVGAVAGIVTLTCMTPEIRLAAEPAYRTGASMPPMVTVTGRTGCLRAERTGGMTTPSAPPGSV